MKIKFLIAMLLFFSIFVKAQDKWKHIGTASGGDKYYIDTSSIKREGEYIQFWLEKELNEAQYLLEEQVYYTSEFNIVLADCRKMALLQYIRRYYSKYSKNIVKEKSILLDDARRYMKGKSPETPKTIGWDILEETCKKY